MQAIFNPRTLIKPPQPPPRWNHSASEIIELTEQAIEQNRKEQTATSAIPSNECNFTNVRCYPYSETSLLICFCFIMKVFVRCPYHKAFTTI
jgi:hypothetical protein